jgi:hypothetical protein
MVLSVNRSFRFFLRAMSHRLLRLDLLKLAGKQTDAAMTSFVAEHEYQNPVRAVNVD